MSRPHSPWATVVALILLSALAAVCVRLGLWQLDRAAERDALAAQIEAGRQLPPLALDTRTPPQALTPWRPAQVRGQWRHDLTVLLDNRNHDGRPGYWVATPLVVDERVALLVLRGWLPREQGSLHLPDVPEPSGERVLQGELLSHVPRLFELWSWSDTPASGGLGSLPAPEGAPPLVQNLTVAQMSAATGLQWMPVVLAQTQAAGPDDTLARDWPAPSLDADKNRGYALQWFGFASIALIAALVMLWRRWRRAGPVAR